MKQTFAAEFSPDALILSWAQLNHYARTEDAALDPFETFMFDQHVGANANLLSELASVSYQFAPYTVVLVPKAGQDRRKVWMSAEDAVVAQALMNVIGPVLESQMLPVSYGNRLDPSGSSSRVIFRPWLDAYSGYRKAIWSFLKLPPSCYYRSTDLSSFYPSVNKDALLSSLYGLVLDERHRKLIEQLVRYKWVNPDQPDTLVPDDGLPQGPAYSAVLANFYLTPVDTWLSNRLKGYARYVDDMCLVFESEADSKAAWDELLLHLKGMGLHVSDDKTSEAAPISNGLIARDLLERIRYQDDEQRFFGSVAKMTEANRNAVAEQLREAFLETKDPIKLAEAARRLYYLFKSERRLNLSEDRLHETISDVVLVLKSGPIKPSTTRGLVRQILEFFEGDPPHDIREAIRDCHNYVRLAFLEAVREFKDAKPGLQEFIRSFCEPHYDAQVRAAAFMTLFKLVVRIDVRWLSELIRTANPFVQARALLCLCNAPIQEDELVQLLPQYISSQSDEVVCSSLFVLCERCTSGGADLVLPYVNPDTLKRPMAISQFVYTCLRFSKVHLLAGLFHTRLDVPGLAEATRSCLAELRTEILAGHLPQNVLWNLWAKKGELSAAVSIDLMPDLEYGIKATASPTGGELPDTLKALLETVSAPTIRTPLAKLAVHPVLRQLKDKDLSYSVIDRGGPDEQVVETITPSKLAENGKTKDFVYGAYGLLPEEIRCPFEHTGTISGSSRPLRMHYRIPTGFQLVATGPTLTPLAALRAVRELAVLGRDGYTLPPLDPYHVLVNSEGHVKLIAYGAIVGVPKFSATSGKEDILIGGVTTIYCLGLLLYDMVTRKCSLTTIKQLESGITYEQAKQTGRWPRLRDAEELANHPHVRWIIDKAARRDWNDRYQQYNVFLEDLDAAIRFLDKDLEVSVTEYSAQQYAEIHAMSIRIRHYALSEQLSSRGFLFQGREILNEAQTFLTDSRLALTQGFLRLSEHPSVTANSPLSQIFQLADRLNRFIHSVPGLAETSWRVLPNVAKYLAYRLELSRVVRFFLLTIGETEAPRRLRALGEDLPSPKTDYPISVRPRFMSNDLKEIALPAAAYYGLLTQLRVDAPFEEGLLTA